MEKKNLTFTVPISTANLYGQPMVITVRDIPKLLNSLHDKQLDMIDEAVLKSNLRDANEVIKYIMEKK
jgi:hypothetical protein